MKKGGQKLTTWWGKIVRGDNSAQQPQEQSGSAQQSPPWDNVSMDEVPGHLPQRFTYQQRGSYTSTSSSSEYEDTNFRMDEDGTYGLDCLLGALPEPYRSQSGWLVKKEKPRRVAGGHSRRRPQHYQGGYGSVSSNGSGYRGGHETDNDSNRPPKESMSTPMKVREWLQNRFSPGPSGGDASTSEPQRQGKTAKKQLYVSATRSKGGGKKGGQKKKASPRK